jgi:lipoyl(octanoyl) transferase
MPRVTTEHDFSYPADPAPYSIRFHLLSTVDYERFLRLQRRLVYEAGGYDDGRITVLLCEHPALISVGRSGSRGHIRLSGEQLRRRHLSVRWVSRGGGCVLHGPGQIAVYPIVPLRWHGWSVGEYLERLRQSLAGTLDQLLVRYEFGQQPGLWGRSGQLATWGIAVRNWITCHGAFINVNPMMTHYPFVDSVDPFRLEGSRKSTMGCLFAERRRAMTVAKVRATLIPNLAAALGTESYHLITGHPLLSFSRRAELESRSRAS